MSLISNEVKAQILEGNDILEIVQEYVQLKKDGSIYRGRCPFHEEKDPSFVVYPEGQKYYCYGCEAGTKGKTLTLKDGTTVIDGGNDVIAFIMNIERLSFVDACKLLMKRIGMDVATDLDPETQRLREEVTARNRYYWQALQKSPETLEYLTQRGVTQESINNFRLGLVPADDPNPAIRNRLVFGIMDVHQNPAKAHTLFMAYRTLNNEEPKYRNDSGKVFSKKQTLYLLSHASTEIRKRGYAIVVEGYVDAILAHQAGLKNTVAIMGTSFNEEQAGILRKYTDKILLWYDSDEPGQTAALKHLPMLLSKGFSVILVQCPFPGLDPADIIQRQGSAGLEKFLLSHSRPAVQVVIDQQLATYDSIISQEAIRVLNKLNPLLETIQQPAERIVFTNTVMQRLKLQ